MNKDMQLVKIIADLAVFLEFTDEALLDPDLAVQALEQVAAGLQLMDNHQRNEIANTLKDLSKQYTGDKEEYIRSLPESLGLI